MILIQKPKRRRPLTTSTITNTSNSSNCIHCFVVLLRRIQNISVLFTEIMIILFWSLTTKKNNNYYYYCFNYNSRLSLLPLVNSFTPCILQYHSQTSTRRRQWFNVVSQQELPNIHSIADIQQRYIDPSHHHHQQHRIRAISATTIKSSSSSSSAAADVAASAETYSLINETSWQTLSSLATSKMIESDEVWDAYVDLMHDIIDREFRNSSRGVRPEELSRMKEYLMQNQRIIPVQPFDLSSESRDTIHDRLNEQKALFLRVTNFNAPTYAAYCRCLIYVSDFSARKQIRSSALAVWYKIRECGLCPRENAISTCLYTLSLQQQTLSRSTRKTPTSTDNSSALRHPVHFDELLFKNACFDVAIFHDMLYHLNEKTALVRIKGYIADHNVQAAEEVLAKLQIKTQDDSLSCKRLRTYQPIFQYYCTTGNMIEAFRIYREMQHTSGVYLIPETYAMLISAAAKHGWFRDDNDDEMLNRTKSVHIKTTMKQLKFRSHFGPRLLDELCSEMSRDILELDESCAAMIMDGFNIGFNYSNANVPKPGWISDIAQWVQRFLQSPTYVKTRGATTNRRIFLERVSIDNTTAICQSTGAKLRLLTLSKQQIRNVHDSLIQMAESEQEKFHQGSNNNNKGKKTDMNGTNNLTRSTKLKTMNVDANNTTMASKELSLFSDWLRYRGGDPFTAIVDGPNVAYYGIGSVQWGQVEEVMSKLERMGENPLVIMPQKYISSKFYIASLGRVQELSTSDLVFINKLIKAKKMYVVPSGCLDDYYWMLSSVAEQKTGSNYVQQHITTDDTMGRFPGLRPLLVTNDQMRDHRLALLEPRLFRRWASCHIVKYHIAPPAMPVNDEGRVTLFPADFFSREIQCNKASRFGDNTVWHIPIAEWPEPDRLCISVMR